MSRRPQALYKRMKRECTTVNAILLRAEMSILSSIIFIDNKTTLKNADFSLNNVTFAGVHFPFK